MLETVREWHGGEYKYTDGANTVNFKCTILSDNTIKDLSGTVHQDGKYVTSFSAYQDNGTLGINVEGMTLARRAAINPIIDNAIKLLADTLSIKY